MAATSYGLDEAKLFKLIKTLLLLTAIFTDRVTHGQIYCLDLWITVNSTLKLFNFIGQIGQFMGKVGNLVGQVGTRWKLYGTLKPTYCDIG